MHRESMGQPVVLRRRLRQLTSGACLPPSPAAPAQCASACPPGIKIKNCARCTFNNLCLACKAGWRLDAQGWCVRGKRQKQRRR